jgi:hypothetical protein
LTQLSTDYYAVADLGGADSGGRLRGVWCSGMADALAGSDAGADFLVLRDELPHEDIRSICELVPIPVYVPGLALKEAWELGATGSVAIGD